MNYIENLREELKEFDELNSMLDSIEENIFMEELAYKQDLLYEDYIMEYNYDMYYADYYDDYYNHYFDNYDKALEELDQQTLELAKNNTYMYNEIMEALHKGHLNYLQHLIKKEEYRDMYFSIIDGLQISQRTAITLLELFAY